MPQTEDIEYIKKYEAYDCINTSEDDDFDPLDELYEPDPVEIQNTSQNPFTAKVFDPETMLFDLAETRKTETKFRENILSLMMSVLISSDKPNALLCGPAGCGKTKIVEELAYRLKSSENIVPQLKGYRIYALQLSDIVADSGLMGDLENKVKIAHKLYERPGREANFVYRRNTYAFSGKGISDRRSDLEACSEPWKNKAHRSNNDPGSKSHRQRPCLLQAYDKDNS